MFKSIHDLALFVQERLTMESVAFLGQVIYVIDRYQYNHKIWSVLILLAVKHLDIIVSFICAHVKSLFSILSLYRVSLQIDVVAIVYDFY